MAAAVLNFPVVRKRLSRSGKKVEDQYPSPKRHKREIWFLKELEISSNNCQSLQRTQNKMESCTHKELATPRRSRRLAAQKTPKGTVCACKEADKENFCEDPLCIDKKTRSIGEKDSQKCSPKLHQKPSLASPMDTSGHTPVQEISPTTELVNKLSDLDFIDVTPTIRRRRPEAMPKPVDAVVLLKKTPKKASPTKVKLERDSRAKVQMDRKTPAKVQMDRKTPAKVQMDRKTPAKVQMDRKTPAKVQMDRKTPAKVQVKRETVEEPESVNEEMKMVGRESELSLLKTFIEGHVTSKVAGSMYVSGPPGTGKSASIHQLLQQEERFLKNVVVIQVNCMSLKSPQAVYKQILDHLQSFEKKGAKKSSSSVSERIKSITTSSSKMILLILDEIDQLGSKGQEVLYSIFEWPSLQKSKLILIGIANALDLTDRVLPRLRLKLECTPELLHFAPYSKDQLVAILEKSISAQGKGLTFDPSAIQFCARKVSSVHGDLRKAVNVCRRAAEVLEAKRKLSINELADAPLKVTIPVIAQVLSEVYGSRLTAASDDCFPLQQKIAVCVLLLLVRGKHLKEVPLGKLYDSYVKVCQKRQVKYEAQAEFVNVCRMLEARGILHIKSGKETRLCKVTLAVQECDVESALQDKTLLSTVLQIQL